MLTIVATCLCFALAFSSMVLSWFILMPRDRTPEGTNPGLPH
jgi:hypothetical protein